MIAEAAVPHETAPWRGALAGALVAGLVTLVGLGTGTLWDNSETAYGEVAREILVYHDVVVLHFNGVPYFVQPPLYFWLAAAFASVLGVGEFALRLPSALATIAMGALVAYVVQRAAGLRAGILASVILSTCLMQAIVGRLAIMDALLDLCVTAAILAWYLALHEGSARWWYAGWTSVALGVLAKGPVAPAIAVLVVGTWAAWERRTGARLHVPAAGAWLLGGLLAAGIVLPWPLAEAQRVGTDGLAVLIGHYTVGRYLGTIENQGGPIWYYVPVVILGFFPWIAFLAPALADGAREARDPGRSLLRLALAWAAVPFAFFSLAQTKLPNYLALELAALAILVALWFVRQFQSERRRTAIAWALLLPVACAGLAFAVAAFTHDNKLAPDYRAIGGYLAVVVALLAAGSVLCFALLLRRATAPLAPYALALASMATWLEIAAVAEPYAERLKPIPPLAAVIQRVRQPGDVVALDTGVSGGNALLFYTMPPLRMVPDLKVHTRRRDPEFLRNTVCGTERVFLVSRKIEPEDSSFGRVRHVVATSGKYTLFRFDGPDCTPKGRSR